jgi:hypothetical protein
MIKAQIFIAVLGLVVEFAGTLAMLAWTCRSAPEPEKNRQGPGRALRALPVKWADAVSISAPRHACARA